MASVPLEHGLLLATVLFALGLLGVLVRRNVIFILMSIEIMLNAAGLAFVVAGARWQQPDGQVMFLFILAMAAAEVSVGLALVLQLYHRFRTLDADQASTMRGEDARTVVADSCLAVDRFPDTGAGRSASAAGGGCSPRGRLGRPIAAGGGRVECELRHLSPHGSPIAVAAAALLLGGALGKSAQLPLQTWLPDAMAGPTPVSALIHAATMVTAGVYLIARTNVLFTLAPPVQTAVGVIGAVTLLLAGFSALTQWDIKRVLAYSTISQIGYMFLALGVGARSAAIFHFMTHAFFKALPVLGAGVVILGLEHEHNMFKMRGLRRHPLPFGHRRPESTPGPAYRPVGDHVRGRFVDRDSRAGRVLPFQPDVGAARHSRRVSGDGPLSVLLLLGADVGPHVLSDCHLTRVLQF